MTAPDRIAGMTLAEWREFARLDNCLEILTPSELRLLIAAIPEPRATPAAMTPDADALYSLRAWLDGFPPPNEKLRAMYAEYRAAVDAGAVVVGGASAPVAAMTPEVRALVEAAEPLAAMASRYDPEDGDGDLECWFGLAVPKIKHIRALRAALAALREGGGA